MVVKGSGTMAIVLPHIEDSNLTKYITPFGEYEQFQTDSHYTEKLKEWALSSKKEFWYKDKTYQRIVTIKGYQTYGQNAEYNTLIIEFQDGNLSCISPAYLKEMQSSNFGKESVLQDTSHSIKAVESVDHEPTVNDPTSLQKEANIHIEEVSADTPSQPLVKEVKSPKPKKEKVVKLVLPEDKVHFTARVKQFALSWNHFNEENDEVIVLEEVRIEQEAPVEVGLAWCAHSKTLKKFELTLGEELEFDGKIVKKSLPKGKNVEDEELRLEVSVPYKINNPSKITKK
jgi:hypothetical protein